MNIGDTLVRGPLIAPPTPPGLEALYTLCRKIYPNQPNPLQVTALLKYWLGGPDPLDYVSMYSNPGSPSENIPEHWHYISFGLSDLHGDGRVHELNPILCLSSSISSLPLLSSSDSEASTSKLKDDTNCPPSGFGFELTFRLKKSPSETSPPTWPAALMQTLAKYVFKSGTSLCVGDHVSWHNSLDGSTDSRMQHILMALDPQLKSVTTPMGHVEFVQIVGVCNEELKAAQQWNGKGVLNILQRVTNDQWLVTDMRRPQSIFEMDMAAHEQVSRGFELDGADLSGVSASQCLWQPLMNGMHSFGVSPSASGRFFDNVPHHSLGHKSGSSSSILNMPPPMPPPSEMFMQQHVPAGMMSTMTAEDVLQRLKLDQGVHLVFNLEAGSLLPLAIRGRVCHGRHFTFKSMLTDVAITLVAASVTGTMVDAENPYVAKGAWLQILIDDSLARDMALTFQVLSTPELLSLPKTFSWFERKLSITIVPDK